MPPEHLAVGGATDNLGLDSGDGRRSKDVAEGVGGENVAGLGQNGQIANLDLAELNTASLMGIELAFHHP